MCDCVPAALCLANTCVYSMQKDFCIVSICGLMSSVLHRRPYIDVKVMNQKSTYPIGNVRTHSLPMAELFRQCIHCWVRPPSSNAAAVIFVLMLCWLLYCCGRWLILLCG